jgi:hypothetical protein
MCSKACARRGCRRNEQVRRRPAGAGAILVACRLTGLSALEGQYDRVDERVQICRRGPSAPQAREPSLFASRQQPRWIGSPWPRRGTRAAPPRSCPALTMLFSGLDCRRHLARAARLITERRACIPGRRVPSVQRGNAAMPKPINDIALAFLRSLPEACRDGP